MKTRIRLIAAVAASLVLAPLTRAQSPKLPEHVVLGAVTGGGFLSAVSGGVGISSA